MYKTVLIFSIFILSIILGSCTAVKEKTDAIVERENQKLSKFIGKTTNDLLLVLGNPDEDFKNENGNLELVYKEKKYGITCERKFQIDDNSVVIGFVSNGCF